MTHNDTAAELASTYTIAELRDQIISAGGNLTGTSKYTKARLADKLATLRAIERVSGPAPVATLAQPETDEDFALGDVPEQEYDASVGEPQVFQGAMHEAGPDLMADTFRVLSSSTLGVRDALSTLGAAAQDAARKLAAVAWARHVAVVRSMGRTVRGKVVDTVLRTPDATGMNRVCLVVEHPNGKPGRKATRTLHALADIKFEPLAS